MSSKKVFLVLLTIIFITLLNASDTLEIHKNEIIDIMQLYKLDNEKRDERLKPIKKVVIEKPVYKPKLSKKINKNENITKDNKPIVHDFTHTTVWGEFKVQIIEYPDKNFFKFGFDSKYPVQGVEIIDSESKNGVYNKNLNDLTMYSDQVNYTFKPVYLMILKANINNEIQPCIIPLYKKEKVKIKWKRKKLYR